MARPWPPDGAIDRQMALDVALTGLIGANGAQMRDACVAAALWLVEEAWKQGNMTTYHGD